jgi:polyribonucleotide nucleotidyltransferase
MREGQGFFPLTVNYQEKFYAGGKIPGSFFRREGKATERETLICRLIDRPMRPLFPKGFLYETQIMPTVISSDRVNDPDTLAIVAASAAVEVSDIPFAGPIAGVRVGRVNGEFIANPTLAQMAESDIDIVVAGSRDAVIMVEGEASFVPEKEMLEAIFFGHQAMQPLIEAQAQLSKLVGKPKREFVVQEADPALLERVTALAEPKILEAVRIRVKQERYAAVDQARAEVQEALAAEFPERAGEISSLFGKVEKKVVRQMVTKDRCVSMGGE